MENQTIDEQIEELETKNLEYYNKINDIKTDYEEQLSYLFEIRAKVTELSNNWITKKDFLIWFENEYGLDED